MEKLFAMQDADYRDFHAKLIPNIPYETIIGVRTPALRAFSKEFWKSAEKDDFMAHLPHTYYEENNLHGFLIEFIRDFDETVAALDAFLPYVDNWATCDMMNPKSLKKDKAALLAVIRRWLASDHAYTVRFGIKTLMQYYLGEDFRAEYAEMVLAVYLRAGRQVPAAENPTDLSGQADRSGNAPHQRQVPNRGWFRK